MENKKQITKKFVLLAGLILLAVILYFYSRVFAKAIDSNLALSFPVAMRIFGRSSASLLGWRSVPH